jgi:hypothetical protein
MLTWCLSDGGESHTASTSSGLHERALLELGAALWRQTFPRRRRKRSLKARNSLHRLAFLILRPTIRPLSHSIAR